jgi:cytidylate kinase
MNFPASIGRLTEAVARSHEYEQSRPGPRGPQTKTPFTIALAREAGTPGTTVARTVGERLGWSVYDQELVERIAQDLKVRPALLESVDERHHSWLLEIVEAFGSRPGVSESGYVYRMVQTVAALASHGKCVLVGRGAAMVLPRETTLRVRLVGDRADRIEATRLRLGLAQAEAERWVDETEQARFRFVQAHLRKDVRDPVHYDLILNTSRWSVAECADFIVDALRRLESRTGQAGPEATASQPGG